MLRQGIPAFRLERSVLDAELDRLRGIGVEIRCGVRVGRDVGLDALGRDHDAVVVAVGGHASRSMPIEGLDEVRNGVLTGLSFLDRYNSGEPVPVGRRVGIVGGGNTAIDCARAAVRLGAEAVIVYRRTEEEMPAIPDEVEEARREEVRFRFQRLPVRLIVDAEGRLEAVETVEMVPGPPEADGRRRPVPVEESRAREPFDTLILAIGEEADLALLAGSDVRHDGRISVNFAGATSRPGVFACGDAAFGHGTVTQGIATGRRTAELVSEHLERGGGR